MKKIVINNIQYHNFKNLRDFTLDLQGNDAAVYAQNEKGKTTLFDGFVWLLFGKNSSDLKVFNAKPLDSEGNEILGLEPCVTAELISGNEKITLKRELKEVWRKQHGELEKVRKSDTTKFYINDVPTKSGEYQQFIASIIDEQVFKIITNPFQFTSLKWTEQRELLTGLIDNISDEEIISSNSKLKDLNAILGDHSIEEQRKIIKAKKSEVKNDIDSLPARIDEAQRAMPDVSEMDKNKLQTTIKEQEQLVEDLRDKLALEKNSDAKLDLKMQRGELDARLIDAKNSFMSSNLLETESLNADVHTVQQSVNNKRRYRDELQQDFFSCENNLEVAGNKKVKLLDDYHHLKRQLDEKEAATFDEHQLNCPTCGQELPENQTEELRSKFNIEKSQSIEILKKDIEKIVFDGNSMKEQIEIYSADIKELDKKNKEAESDLENELKKLDILNDELLQVKNKQGSFEDTSEYKKIMDEIELIKQKSLNDLSDNQQAIQIAKEKLDGGLAELSILNDQFSLFKQFDEQEKRIAELTEQDKQLKELFMELEKQSYLLDEFTRSKVAVMESKINEKFEYVDFKLFYLQKDGQLAETCEATYKGVPYTTDLNTAAKINCGLDIINTISKHYGLVAPIFVDNAESVNKLIDTNTQIISLIVSNDDQLRVELLDGNLEEAI